MSIRGFVTVCAACGLTAAGARAEIVSFINPAPGAPGHFDWYAPNEDARFLDVTASASQQVSQWNSTSIGQGVTGLPAGGTFGFMIGTAMFAVQGGDATVLALSAGDSLLGLAYDAYGSHAWGDPPFTLSPFPEGERRFVGVRTPTGNYAWIEVERTGLSLRAFAWAYETEPGVPILAGQVPAPGTAVMLAMTLATGLRRRPS